MDQRTKGPLKGEEKAEIPNRGRVFNVSIGDASAALEGLEWESYGNPRNSENRGGTVGSPLE